MNQRAAKREATRLAAVAIRGLTVEGDDADVRRLHIALLELADELERRVTRQRKSNALPVVDPDQAMLFPDRTFA